MRDAMKYFNHYNEEIDFGSANILINMNDFRDYKWSYNSQYNKITSFEKKIKSNKLPVIVVGEDAREVANHIFEVIEKDVLTNTAGKMFIGDYYLRGYFVGSIKKDYKHENVVELELEFISDQGYWLKESPFLFRIDDEGTGGDEFGLGYSYDYPYGFSSPISSQNMVNTSFVPANFIINIYGAVTNPHIIVGGNTYHIAETLLENEILTINSREKVAYLTTAEGERRNVFSKRDMNYYLFEKIPTGVLKVLYEPECNFDIVLLEERSEPQWT